MKALLLSAAAVLLAGSAMAAPIHIDFTTNNPSNTFSSAGIVVTPTAWSNTGASGALAAAALGRYSLGLGVCDTQEGGAGCSSPEHQVDNYVQRDFVLFTFSGPINSVSFTVTPSGNYDTDVTFYSRTLGTAFNLSGTSIAGLAGLGFTQGGDDITATGVAHTFNVTGNGITSVLLGAKVSGNDSLYDYFKITSMDGATPSGVPEPSTMAMLGGALCGLGLLRRFKGSKKA